MNISSLIKEKSGKSTQEILYVVLIKQFYAQEIMLLAISMNILIILTDKLK
jgi:hypothetical protein